MAQPPLDERYAHALELNAARQKRWRERQKQSKQMLTRQQRADVSMAQGRATLARLDERARLARTAKHLANKALHQVRMSFDAQDRAYPNVGSDLTTRQIIISELERMAGL
jgi:hypothetical protein